MAAAQPPRPTDGSPEGHELEQGARVLLGPSV